MLKPLQRHTIVDDIIDSILNMARTGQIRPGDKLPGERDLAAQLKVSRTSVREAMKALAFTNAITIKPGDGTYFNDIPHMLAHINKDSGLLKYRSEFRQVSEARRILETQMVALTAKRVRAEALAEMENSLQIMDQIVADPNITDMYTEFALEDMNFHNIIAKASQNDILYQALSAIWHHVTELVLIVASVPDRAVGSNESHKQIYNAIKNGNADLAMKLMNEHMDYNEENVNRYFDSFIKENGGSPS